MERNKQEFLIFTYKHSPIDIVCPNYDMMLKKYTPKKIYSIIDLIDELVELNNKASLKVPVIILFNQTYIDKKEIDEVRNNKKLSQLSPFEIDIYDSSYENFLMLWAHLMAQIQKRLSHINICFLFTTYNKGYKHLLNICQRQGLKNFRFITEPFFVKELEQSIDNLYLRYYTNKSKRLSFKKKNKKVI